MRKIVQCSACNGADTSLMCGESKKLSISAVGKFKGRASAPSCDKINCQLLPITGAVTVRE
jgi:hypothetical protein